MTAEEQEQLLREGMAQAAEGIANAPNDGRVNPPWREQMGSCMNVLWMIEISKQGIPYEDRDATRFDNRVNKLRDHATNTRAKGSARR